MKTKTWQPRCATNNWRVHFKEIKEKLEEMNNYLEAGDLLNAHRLQQYVLFNLRFYGNVEITAQQERK